MSLTNALQQVAAADNTYSCCAKETLGGLRVAGSAQQQVVEPQVGATNGYRQAPCAGGRLRLMAVAKSEPPA